MIDTVIFDNEGVIADTEPVWDMEQEIFLGRRGITYQRDKTKHLLGGKSIAEGAKILKDIYNLPGDDYGLTGERLSIVKELLHQKIKFVRGFPEFYRETSHRYKTCVATSMDDALLAIVDSELHLTELFKGRVYTLKHVDYKSKPNPDIFLYAARMVKTLPAKCVVIEDSPNGILAAKAAGMKSIALTTTYTKDKLMEADLIIDSFSDIDEDTLGLI